MDTIISLNLAETAQNLQVDRGLILRLKYLNPISTKEDHQEIPNIKVEIFFDWTKEEGIIENKSIFSYKLLDSPLTIYALQKVPNILSFSNEKELENIGLKNDLKSYFPLENNEVKSLIILPLIGNFYNQEDIPITIGFLLFYKKNVYKWKKSQIEIAKNVAFYSSLSIIHQQTLNKVQSLVDERTAQLKMSLDVQAKLSAKMHYHIAELNRLNKVKDQFIANLSDALKNPLATMKMGIKMLKLMGDSPQNQLYLDILESECEKEINLVNNLLNLQKIESKNFEINTQQFDLVNILQKFRDEFYEQWSHKKLNLIVDNKLDFINTDLNSFQLIFRELLKNAGKFSYAENDVIFKCYFDDKFNIFEIINVGDEIPKNQQKKIFTTFYQNKNDAQISNTGTGLGLALVKSLVENLQGNITVSNVSNSTHFLTTFTITFPRHIDLN